MQNVKRNGRLFQSGSTIIAFLLLLFSASFFFRGQHFLSSGNIVNILMKAAKNGGILAMGMTFVILCGEIDLAAGSLYALSGVAMALAGAVHPALGIASGLLTGIVSGWLIGLMVTKMRISSWIASLSMLFAQRGLILILSKKSVPVTDPVLTLGNTKILKGIFPELSSGISVLIPILFILTFVCMYIARNTRFGMGIYAAGGNGEAARMMGIPVDRIKQKAFICSGLIAALSGMLQASSSGSATLSAGNMYETYAIAMCAIGGVKLTGGEGRFSGTFFGVLIYFIINTIFTYLPTGITVHWQSIIMGLLVLVSVGIQTDALGRVSLKRKTGKTHETSVH